MERQTRNIQEQRMQQKLAPMQVQYVRMLEMTTPEIEDAVRRAIEDNPALEVADTTNASPDNEQDLNHEDYTDKPTARNTDAWIYAVATDSSEDTLTTHLEKQLSESDADDRTLALAEYLLGEIDGNGRISRSPKDIADDIAFNTGGEVSTEEIADALNLIKSLDPPGVGAADLRECLLIQLRSRHSEDQANKDAISLLENHYDLYSRRRLDMLRSASGLDTGRLRNADELIRSLNPKPGAQFAEGDRMERASSVVVPDFNLDIDDNGNITVSLTSDIPELSIAESFNIRTKNDDFIRHHHDEASSTIKLLQMRGRTLIRTMKAIAYLQRDFFLSEEKEKIHPMVLRDIAQITGDDLSVISRATAGKYVNTPGGVYPLKMFFSERTQADNSGSGSLHRVLSALKAIIDSEDPQHPYPDETLRLMMKEKGFDLARRTIAKYREEKLGVPVARLRRQV